MGLLRAIECKDLKDYRAKNKLAHNILKGNENYNSPYYAGEVDIYSVNDKPLLIEIKQFSKELKKGGLNFQDLDKSIIKVEEEIN